MRTSPGVGINRTAWLFPVSRTMTLAIGNTP
jgi:hypothetical protein